MTRDRTFRLRDVARELALSTRTLRRYIATGKLDATRLPSGHYRIAEHVLDAFRDAHQKPQNPPRHAFSAR